ncbi:MAG: DUF2849 domain-containing protein [Pseudomonadota bacterium]
MKAVTVNRLTDGVVMYLGADDSWVEGLEDAVLFEGLEADDALARASARVTEIAGAYLIEATPEGAAGREAIRETIRSKGPTVREDLGKQAGRSVS